MSYTIPPSDLTHTNPRRPSFLTLRDGDGHGTGIKARNMPIAGEALRINRLSGLGLVRSGCSEEGIDSSVNVCLQPSREIWRAVWVNDRESRIYFPGRRCKRTLTVSVNLSVFPDTHMHVDGLVLAPSTTARWNRQQRPAFPLRFPRK